ncbi:hypothetical protein BB560_005825 [Smittium megazygosporum]|uniref:DMAP1-binding domain-containing protein n=1 Tax=Smittium megazygosporum TaxID=133381 RepID=A0A2T9YUR8_9FUNG|nr:hypothetical protein BB560_005825 [Smittium megazygosporum]
MDSEFSDLNIPKEFIDSYRELETDFSEGYITQKGFEKKVQALCKRFSIPESVSLNGQISHSSSGSNNVAPNQNTYSDSNSVLLQSLKDFTLDQQTANPQDSSRKYSLHEPFPNEIENSSKSDQSTDKSKSASPLHLYEFNKPIFGLDLNFSDEDVDIDLNSSKYLKKSFYNKQSISPSSSHHLSKSISDGESDEADLLHNLINSNLHVSNEPFISGRNLSISSSSSRASYESDTHPGFITLKQITNAASTRDNKSPSGRNASLPIPDSTASNRNLEQSEAFEFSSNLKFDHSSLRTERNRLKSYAFRTSIYPDFSNDFEKIETPEVPPLPTSHIHETDSRTHHNENETVSRFSSSPGRIGGRDSFTEPSSPGKLPDFDAYSNLDNSRIAQPFGSPPQSNAKSSNLADNFPRSKPSTSIHTIHSSLNTKKTNSVLSRDTSSSKPPGFKLNPEPGFHKENPVSFDENNPNPNIDSLTSPSFNSLGSPGFYSFESKSPENHLNQNNLDPTENHNPQILLNSLGTKADTRNNKSDNSSKIAPELSNTFVHSLKANSPIQFSVSAKDGISQSGHSVPAKDSISRPQPDIISMSHLQKINTLPFLADSVYAHSDSGPLPSANTELQINKVSSLNDGNAKTHKKSNRQTFYSPYEKSLLDSPELSRLSGFGDIHSILRYRAETTPKQTAFSCIDKNGVEVNGITWSNLYIQSLQIYKLLISNNVRYKGDKVALVFRRYEFINYISSLFACFHGGFIAVPLISSDSLADLSHILKTTRCKLALSTQLNIDALSIDLNNRNGSVSFDSTIFLREVKWVNVSSTIIDHSYSSPKPSKLIASDTAYIEFTKNPSGELKGVVISHGSLLAQCLSWVVNTGMLGTIKHFSNKPESAIDASLKSLSNPTNSSPAKDAEKFSKSNPKGLNYSAINQLKNNAHSMLNPRTANAMLSANSRAQSYSPALKPVSSKQSSTSLKSKFFNNKLFNKLKNAHELNSETGNARYQSVDLSQGLPRKQNQNINAFEKQSDSRSVRSVQIEHLRHNSSVFPENHSLSSSKDVLLIQIEPRQMIGLSLGVFTGVFSGHETIYLSKNVLENPGLYLRILTKYNVTIVLGDYLGLQKVLMTALDNPQVIDAYNDLSPPSLHNLRLLLINTHTIDLEFHRMFNSAVLRKYGCPLGIILETYKYPVLNPVCTLPELGGILVSMINNKSPVANQASNGAQSFLSSNNGSLGLNNGIVDIFVNKTEFHKLKIVLVENQSYSSVNDDSNVLKISVFGSVAQNTRVAIVDPENKVLCDFGDIGEIWMDSDCAPSGFWVLPRLSESIFNSQFFYLESDIPKTSTEKYLRTGLMGAIVNGNILILGYYEDILKTFRTRQLIQDSGNLEMSSYFFNEISLALKSYYSPSIDVVAFEIQIKDSSLIVVLFEIPLATPSLALVSEDIYNLLLKRCDLTSFAIGLCAPNTLPRAYQYGQLSVNTFLSRQAWESGNIDCLYVRYSTEYLYLGPSTILPKNQNPFLGSQDSSQNKLAMIHGSWLQLTGYEQVKTSLDDISNVNLAEFASITQILIFRSSQQPGAKVFSDYESRGTENNSISFHNAIVRITDISKYMSTKMTVIAGEYVIIILQTGIELALALHSCFAIGAIPIPIAPLEPDQIQELISVVVATSKQYSVKTILLDFKIESRLMEIPSFSMLLKQRKIRLLNLSKKLPRVNPQFMLGLDAFQPYISTDPDSTALVMVYNNILSSAPTFVSLSRKNIINFCIQQKVDFHLTSNNPIIASARSYNGYGLLQLSCLGVFVGCQTIILPPAQFFMNPLAWMGLVSKFKIKNPFITVPMLEHAMNMLESKNTNSTFQELKASSRRILGPVISLAHVSNLIVATEDPLRPELVRKFSSFLLKFNLNPNVINPLYGCQMCVYISTSAYLGVESLTLALDDIALQHGEVVPIFSQYQNTTNGVEKTNLIDQPGSENNIQLGHPNQGESAFKTSPFVLRDSGKVSSSTLVAIVDPETKAILPAGKIGEIWVYSESGAVEISSINRRLSSSMNNMSQRNSGYDIDGDLNILSIKPQNSIDRILSPANNQANKYNYVRTGDYGFLYLDTKNPEHIQSREPYLFVMGKMNDVLTFNGYSYLRSVISQEIISVLMNLYGASEDCVIIDTILSKYPLRSSFKGGYSSTIPVSRNKSLSKNSFRGDNKSIHSFNLDRSSINGPSKARADSDSLSHSISLKYSSNVQTGFKNDLALGKYQQASNNQSLQKPHLAYDSDNLDSQISKRYVTIITIDESLISQKKLGNLASVVFTHVLSKCNFPLNEIIFVKRNSLPRTRIFYKKTILSTILYESGQLSVLSTFLF